MERDGREQALPFAGIGGGAERVQEQGQRLGQPGGAEREGGGLGAGGVVAPEGPRDHAQVARRHEAQQAFEARLDDLGLRVARERLEVQEPGRGVDARAAERARGLHAHDRLGIREQRRDLQQRVAVVDLDERVGGETSQRRGGVDGARPRPAPPCTWWTAAR